MAMFSSLGIEPRVVQEADHASTILSLISAGLGCSIMMSSVAQTRPLNVKFLPIIDPPPHRPWALMMIWLAENAREPTESFIKAARDYIAQNPQLLDPLDSSNLQ
jgi:DNA-binding transcriptional LysR family regulator